MCSSSRGVGTTPEFTSFKSPAIQICLQAELAAQNGERAKKEREERRRQKGEEETNTKGLVSRTALTENITGKLLKKKKKDIVSVGSKVCNLSN